IIILNYLMFMQYEISNIILDMDNKELTVTFPISFLLKERRYNLRDITRVHFKYHPGPYGTPKYYIYLNDGRKIKHYIPNDIEELAQRLKEEDISVDVDLRSK